MSDIPHIIHYCWFGKGKKNKLFYKCLESWKKYLPGWQIIEWNEDNFDISKSPQYVQEAYSVKKYAFVSDYCRIYALDKFGGVYFDTDLEVLRSFDDLLTGYEFVSGFESKRSLITAFIACVPNNDIICEFLHSYIDRKFIKDDNSYDITPINVRFSKLAEEHGCDLDNNSKQEFDNGRAVVYPVDVFSGFDMDNWHIKVTENTRTVHHMSGSWQPFKVKLYFARIKFLQCILGNSGYDKLKAWRDKRKNR